MMDNLELFQATLDGIQPVDPRWIERAEERQARLTKPPGSLGRLEEIANRLAAIQQTLSVSVERPRIILFAADHGVCAEGVNPYPQAVIGQMGIGNTTAASAMTAMLTGLQPARVVGHGTGADECCMQRKIFSVERTLSLHQPNIKDPIDILATVGGFEIAAMSGVCLGGAANRCAVVVDGFIATAAAAVAIRLNDSVRDYLIAAHCSTEPGQGPLLDCIGHRPLLDLGMRLGEGTGGALAIPIIRAAAEAFRHMATFESAGVSRAK